MNAATRRSHAAWVFTLVALCLLWQGVWVASARTVPARHLHLLPLAAGDVHGHPHDHRHGAADSDHVHAPHTPGVVALDDDPTASQHGDAKRLAIDLDGLQPVVLPAVPQAGRGGWRLAGAPRFASRATVPPERPPRAA